MLVLKYSQAFGFLFYSTDCSEYVVERLLYGMNIWGRGEKVLKE